MLLFSFILIFLSSYFLTSFFVKNEKLKNVGIIYLFLIFFSQIVFSFEILSLFSAISKKNFLICNFIIFLISVILQIKKINLLNPFLSEEWKRIKNALKQDKLLGILSVCFILFLISSLFITLFYPVTFADALSYYFTRCTMWIQNGNISHFITPDSRELIMPVNMEFLYTWVLLFNKSERGLGIFSYIAFINIIFVIYNFLRLLKFSIRKILWNIFVFSSFALVGIMIYTPCADLFSGSLILTSIYLYFVNLKNNDKLSLYFSALALSLSIGTKTTALIAIPSVFIIFCTLTILYKKEEFFKRLYIFCFIFLLNFIIFSSYNYILNFIQFSNPVSNSEQILINKFRGGLLGWISNLIKYSFALFDMSGIENIDFYNNFITYIQNKILSIFGLNTYSYTSKLFQSVFEYDSVLSLDGSFLGALGLFAFLPSLICSLFLRNNKKYKTISVLSYAFIFNIILFALVMVFTKYNMRYLITFVCMCPLILVYSYKKSDKNLYKIICVIFIFIYLFVITNTKSVSILVNYYNYVKNNPQINKELRYEKFINNVREENEIYKYFKKKDKQNIAIIANNSYSILFDIEKLRLYGFKIDKLLLENIENYNLNRYDYLILGQNSTTSSLVLRYEDFIKGKNFVSKCIYFDWEGNTIKSEYTDKIPVQVKCIMPYEYFKSDNFKKVDDINLIEYSIWKRVK